MAFEAISVMFIKQFKSDELLATSIQQTNTSMNIEHSQIVKMNLDFWNNIGASQFIHAAVSLPSTIYCRFGCTCNETYTFQRIF